MTISVVDSMNSLMLALLSLHHNAKLYSPTKEIFSNYMSLSVQDFTERCQYNCFMCTCVWRRVVGKGKKKDPISSICTVTLRKSTLLFRPTMSTAMRLEQRNLFGAGCTHLHKVTPKNTVWLNLQILLFFPLLCTSCQSYRHHLSNSVSQLVK